MKKIERKCKHEWIGILPFADNDWCKKCGTLRTFVRNPGVYSYKWPSNTAMQINGLRCSACSKEYDPKDWHNAWRCNNCF